MKEETLYESITHVDPALIEEASQPRKKPSKKPWLALAACLAVLAGAYGLFRDAPAFLPESPKEEAYLSYAGPAFPLTLRETVPGIEATREIQYDFTVRTPEDPAAGLRETYVLTNKTDRDQQVTALYPMADDLNTEDWPTVLVDGAETAWTLEAGAYAGSFSGTGDGVYTSVNLMQPTSWEDYEALLADGAYMAELGSPVPTFDQPVIVYALEHVTDGGSEARAASVCMDLAYDRSKTRVMTYGFNGGGTRDDGSEYRMAFVRDHMRHPGGLWLILLGEDLNGYTLQGYADGACEPGTELEGCTAQVRRVEMTLGQALTELAGRFYDAQFSADSPVTRELYTQAVLRFFASYGSLGTDPKERYQWDRLDDLIQETMYHERILYAVFALELPAGETVTVEVSRRQQPSFDFPGSGGKKTHGFDLVTTLGSNLTFTAQHLQPDPAEDAQALSLETPHYEWELPAP